MKLDRLAALALAPSLCAASLAAQSAPGAPSSLQRDALGDLSLTRHPDGGWVAFVRGAVRSGVTRVELDADPAAAALAFLARHAEALGFPGAQRELAHLGTEVDELGMTHVRFEQRLEDVPVYGMQVAVHYAASGDAVTAVNGDFVPGLSLTTAPALGPRRAAALARSIEPEAQLQGAPELVVYTQHADPSVAGDHLAWLVRLADERVPSLRLYVVDAHMGAVLKTRQEVCTALNRQIYDANGTTTGVLARAEGGPATGDADVDALYDLLGDTYDYYLNRHGRDSYNGAGATLRGVAHWDGPQAGDCPNAFWDGVSVTFCDGAVVDDIVAHELTHGVTDFEANLIYQDESGALNEAFSDIFGELLDQDATYGDGSATPWQVAEGSSLGVIRNMSNPPAHGDPDQGSNYVCTSGDNGGVHTNSGIANKAAYLIAAGGSFNGATITGLGNIDMGRLFYRALTQYLTPTSDHLACYDALNQSCADLFAAGVCLEVDEALLAVEMDAVASCGFPCPFQTTASAVSGSDPEAAAEMLLAAYRLRGSVLGATPYGRRLVELYYQHGPEMTRILRADPGLQRSVAALVQRLAPGLEALAEGGAEAIAITPHTAALAASVLRSFEQADPGTELSHAIGDLRRSLDLAGLPGRSYAGAWEAANAPGRVP